MNDIPRWAAIRAYDLAFGVLKINGPIDDYDDYKVRKITSPGCYTGRALAEMIAKYEQPPVDPDEVVVNEILSTFHNNNRTIEERKSDRLGGTRFTRAVKRYKKLKETKNES